MSAAKNSRINTCHLKLYVNMNTSYLCGVCSKIVAKNHNAVCCNKCDMWVHTVYNNLSKYCYRKLQKDNPPWFCVNCLRKEMLFSNLSNNQFKTFMSGKTILSPSPAEKNQNYQLNSQEFSAAIKHNLYTPQEINDLEISKESYNLFIHMNIASTSYHIDELHLFINVLKCQPNIIGSECGLIKNKTPLTNTDLPNFCFKFLTAQSRKGGKVQ